MPSVKGWFDVRVTIFFQYGGQELAIMFSLMESQIMVRNSTTLLHSIIVCLNQLLQERPTIEDSQSVFNLRAAPTISISDYLARMFKYMNSSISSFVYALILIDRIQQYNPEFVLHQKNMHRLLLTANVVAAKYLDDFFYKNSFYANVGGVSLKIMNELQTEFMALINFNAHVQEETFTSYLQRLDLFIEVNRKQDNEKQNKNIEKNLMERKCELKNKDSNMQPLIAKGSVMPRTEREPVKIQDTVRTMASQQ